MALLLIIFVFILGLVVGSFLNVLIYRLPKNLNVFKGRSFCPKCKKKLNWWELLPLFSFIFLRGKCSKCKARISWQYPVVELITGALFLLMFIRLIAIHDSRLTINDLWLTIYAWLMISILITIFFIDLKHYIIPDSLIIIGSIVSLFYLFINQFLILNSQFSILGSRLRPSVAFSAGGLAIYDSRVSLFFDKFISIFNFSFPTSHFINHLIFAIIGGGFFGIVILLTKGKGMGMGDMKLAALMGLVLGSKLILAFYFAFISGAIMGLILMIFKKKTLKSKLPFGPFLVFGTILLMLI